MRRAVVFPGQGTVGGEVSGTVREAVRDYLGEAETPYQLSVFAASVVLLYRMRERSIEPDVVAGHSLGEYAAAHATGALGLEDGVRLVAERDRLMGEAAREHPGAMVAVIGADPAEVVQVTEETEGVVVAANFNTPRQTVISGERPAVEAVGERVRGRKVELNVAGAFHSPLMQEASREMDVLLAEVALEEPGIPMVGASDGAVLPSAVEIRRALQDQMLSPVRWVAVVERIFQLGVKEIFEAGEDGILTRMLRDFKEKEVEGRPAPEVLS
jgi:[acyl-carrier-protein] S-malonyltransferase